MRSQLRSFVVVPNARRLSDAQHREIVLTYTLLFFASHFVVKIRALLLPPPLKHRTNSQALRSACKRAFRSLLSDIKDVFIGGSYTERIKDGVRWEIGPLVLGAASSSHSLWVTPSRFSLGQVLSE